VALDLIDPTAAHNIITGIAKDIKLFVDALKGVYEDLKPWLGLPSDYSNRFPGYERAVPDPRFEHGHEGSLIWMPSAGGSALSNTGGYGSGGGYASVRHFQRMSTGHDPFEIQKRMLPRGPWGGLYGPGGEWHNMSGKFSDFGQPMPSASPTSSPGVMQFIREQARAIARAIGEYFGIMPGGGSMGGGGGVFYSGGTGPHRGQRSILQGGMPLTGPRGFESPEVVKAITDISRNIGIDPRVGLAVARSEGLSGFDPATGKWSSGSNDFGTSWGPFQAHIHGTRPGTTARGQGDLMLEQGLDPRKMENWRKTIEWQLNYAKHHGWSEWHGWHGPRWAGIGIAPGGGSSGGAGASGNFAAIRKIFGHPHVSHGGIEGVGNAAGGGPWHETLNMLNPTFHEQLNRLAAAATAAGHHLAVFSGFRSVEHQAALYNAPHRPGYVARPGHSMHGRGLAADLRGDLGWAHQHAAEFGLTFPMPWENWHIEPIGARRQHTSAIGAPPREQPHQKQGHVFLDGRIVGELIERHITKRHLHTHGPGGHDGRRGLTPVDSWSVA